MHPYDPPLINYFPQQIKYLCIILINFKQLSNIFRSLPIPPSEGHLLPQLHKKERCAHLRMYLFVKMVHLKMHFYICKAIWDLLMVLLHHLG